MSTLNCITPEWISAIASGIAAAGVIAAFWQLRLAKIIAQLQFEDSLSKEYRDLAACIPTKALLNESLSEEEYLNSFDEFFRYIDLTNEQIYLRQRKRVSEQVWRNWVAGIEPTLAMPSFQRAWQEIKGKCDSFKELRRLENEGFKVDPAKWGRA